MVLLILGLLGCQDEPNAAVPAAERGAAPEAAPVARLRRLSVSQYHHIVTDVFGDGVAYTGTLEGDERIEGLYAVGSAWTTISSYGVEKYESAAYSVAEQAVTDPDARARWIPCAPADVRDDDCAASVLEPLGAALWRRPLSADELDGLVRVSAEAAVTLDDFDAGLSYGIAAALMSPHFLHRAELAEGEGLDDYALASRLSFFLWDSVPDDTLRDAAADGSLQQAEGLAAAVDRMLEDPRAIRGARVFFAEMLRLDALDGLSKDPDVFVYMSDLLGASAKEETLMGVENLVFTEDGSYLDLFMTRTTYVDKTLAALYAVESPSRDGFGEITLPVEGGRRGFLGQAAFLAPNAHAVSTSATRRGIFVRDVLLCQPIPDPPADANTAIPEVSADAPTMRERIAVHLEDPFCASCHQLTDPIGLGLENFDGLGRWRDDENGATIDPSGALDGASFSDAWALGGALAAHEQTGPCLVKTMLQYATGTLADELDPTLLDWHADGFAEADHRVLWLMRDLALSPAMRAASAPEEER